MTTPNRETISVEADLALMDQLRRQAEQQGRDVQEIVQEIFQEALQTYAAPKGDSKSILEHLEDSMDQHDTLGRLLAR